MNYVAEKNCKLKGFFGLADLCKLELYKESERCATVASFIVGRQPYCTLMAHGQITQILQCLSVYHTTHNYGICNTITVYYFAKMHNNHFPECAPTSKVDHLSGRPLRIMLA